MPASGPLGQAAQARLGLDIGQQRAHPGQHDAAEQTGKPDQRHQQHQRDAAQEEQRQRVALRLNCSERISKNRSFLEINLLT